MVTTNEKNSLHSDRPNRFWNIPRISLTLALVGMILMAATRHIPHPALVIAGAILAFVLLAAQFWWETSRKKSRPMSTSLILGGLVFLGGALYGAMEVSLGQADKLDLVALIIPASLGTWLLRKGLTTERGRRNEHPIGSPRQG
jgi:hypothetical protein